MIEQDLLSHKMEPSMSIFLILLRCTDRRPTSPRLEPYPFCVSPGGPVFGVKTTLLKEI